jgi:hypothetical protein
MDEETDIHSSDGQGFPEKFAPHTPYTECPMTPPPLETETNVEDEEPTPRPPEPPTPCVEEHTEERPSFPRDGEV